MQLMIVRHGESAGDETTPDWLLTSLGERQARLTGRRLATAGVTHILSSPLQRALATATTIADEIGHPRVEVWLELREGLSGTHRGLARTVLQERFPRALLPPEMTAEGWEYPHDTRASFRARCQATLDRIQARFTPADQVVVVCHGGIATYLLHALLQIPPETPSWFALDYCGITVVRLIPEHEQQSWPLYPPFAVEVMRLNDTAHLAGLRQDA